ncbi:MAG: IS66 family insertion sequence element accessory protein TnpB [Erysipelotrichaceae bacterium]
MRASRVSPEEQYRLIMECRRSGLSDQQWCLNNDIKPGTFYNWVKRLRQKGHPDMRKAIDGLCSIIEEQLHMDPRRSALYLFCGKRCDRIKALLWETDGFVLLYKRMEVQGRFRWPRNSQEVRQLTWQQFDWLMSGLEIEQPKAFKSTE